MEENMEEISMEILTLSIYILGSLSIVWLINLFFNAFNDKNTRVRENNSDLTDVQGKIHKL